MLEGYLKGASSVLGVCLTSGRGAANHRPGPPLAHSFDLSSHTPLTPPQGEESVDFLNFKIVFYDKNRFFGVGHPDGVRVPIRTLRAKCMQILRPNGRNQGSFWAF